MNDQELVIRRGDEDGIWEIAQDGFSVVGFGYI